MSGGDYDAAQEQKPRLRLTAFVNVDIKDHAQLMKPMAPRVN